LTFKDLKKRVSLEATTTSQHQQSRLTERLHNKPFWIWNIDKHKQEDIRTSGNCCFNHIIGLLQKDGIDKPLYDYQRVIYDSLVTENGNDNKHLWIKKATRQLILKQQELSIEFNKDAKVIDIIGSTSTVQ
jgi:hypothetical protein